MSIATIVTRGYGTFGSVNKLPTRGFSIGEVQLIYNRDNSVYTKFRDKRLVIPFRDKREIITFRDKREVI